MRLRTFLRLLMTVFATIILQGIYSADGNNSTSFTERDLTPHSTEHSPATAVTTRSASTDPTDDKTITTTTKISSDQRLHITSASTDKATMQTNVPEIEPSTVPQPDIPNSTSKNPMDNVRFIKDLEEGASHNCKVPDDITTARVMSEDDVTVNEITTISSTVMFVRASLADNMSLDNFPDMNEFQLFRIGQNIQRFFFISLFPLFFLCNIVCLLTMLQKHNRGFSTCVFMAALAVNDNHVMLFSLITWIAAEFNLFSPTSLVCSFIVYFNHVLWTLSSYIITTMTYDKMYAIVWPHKSKDKCTAGRARITCLSAAILVPVFFVPLGFFAGINEAGNNCIRYSVEAWYVTLYTHISMVVHPLLPFVSVVTMNSVILLKLCRRQSSGISTSTVSQKAQKQLIIMLLVISSTYLVLTIPFEAREIYSYYDTYGNSPESIAENYFIFAVTYELITINSGINFFLYMLSGRKFRNDLQILLSA